MRGNISLRAQTKLNAHAMLIELGFSRKLGDWHGRKEHVWVHPTLPLQVLVGQGGLLTWERVAGKESGE